MTADIIIVLVFILFIFIGIARGAARTLLNVVAVAVSSVLANLMATAVAQLLYDNFIKASVTAKTEEFIAQSGGQFAAEHSMQALPAGIREPFTALAGLFGTSPEQLQGRLIPSTQQTAELANAIEQPLGGICVFVIGLLISAILFVLLMILLKLIIKRLLFVFEIPVIRQINKILGAFFGALEGVVMILVLVNILYVVMSYTSPALLENSAVFGSVFNALAIFK